MKLEYLAAFITTTIRYILILDLLEVITISFALASGW